VETIILTCLQSQIIIRRIDERAIMFAQLKNELITEVKHQSPKECKYDKFTERSTQLDA
jgi:hypothetical protein